MADRQMKSGERVTLANFEVDRKKRLQVAHL